MIHAQTMNLFILEVDASNGAFVRALSQMGDNWQPYCFSLTQILSNGINYQIHEKELLIILDSLSTLDLKGCL